jgi:hypothetical protein
MKKIQMVDLKGQYQKIEARVKESIVDILDTTSFINGPQVKSFQKNFQKVPSRHVLDEALPEASSAEQPATLVKSNPAEQLAPQK